MTTLDDALNSSAPVYDQPSLTADWREAPPNEIFSTDPESVANMTERLSGEYTVEHSLDDGLPDPVTMTNGNDASGKLTAGLVGTNALSGDVFGIRAGGGTGTSINTTLVVVDLPAGWMPGDFLMVAITVNSITEILFDEDSRWKLLTVVTDSPWQTWVFWIRAYDGMGSAVFTASGPVSYSGTSIAGYAYAADGRIVSLEPGVPVGAAETVIQTGHTTPVVELVRTGWIAAVWSTGISAGPFTPGPGVTEKAEAIGTQADVMMGITAQLEQGRYTMVANSTLATSILTMAAIPIYVVNRKAMEAKSYFSPFNKDSPVYGFDRDTAETEFVFNVLTEAGVEGTTLHKGRMADIVLGNQGAQMEAISKTRIDLDNSLILPSISGSRENASIDWLVTWLMARGGQFAGPGPGPSTIYWAPMYGSVHAHMGPPLGYNLAVFYEPNRVPTGPFGLRPPLAVPGPFVSAMYGCQTKAVTESIRLTPIRLHESREVFPNVAKSFPDGIFADQFSLASTSGRITFWLRGDPADTGADVSYLGPGNDFLFQYNLNIVANGTFAGYVRVKISSHDRQMDVLMGSDYPSDGGALVFSSSITPLETDGEWHFYGIAWDYATGTVKVKKDGLSGSSNFWATAGYNNITGLSTTDAVARAKGHVINNYVDSHLPISDFQIESGAGAFANGWERHYPIPEEMNATMRPTMQMLRAVGQFSTVEGWGTLAELAQSSLTHYRTNEEDNYEFLPLDYFGETEQLTTSIIADTEVNAGDLAVTQDPSHSRNVVTVEFPDTRVDVVINTILALTSSIEIPRGTSDIIFTTDVNIAEIHGASNPLTNVWTLTRLTTTQLANPSTIPASVHFMALNDLADGTGAHYATGVTGTIIAWSASTVTVRFVNTTYKVLYLSHQTQDVPFMRILGYGIRVNDGYVTVRNEDAVRDRGERSLTTRLEWVQDRTTAQEVATLMLNILDRPRAHVNVEVIGDPRRRPGQLVELIDSEGTQAEGTWRILSVATNGNRAKFTQQLSLVRVSPIALWDDFGVWDDSVWSE